MAAKKKKVDSSKVNVSQLAKEKGIDPSIVHNRLHRGWDLEQALNKPVRHRKSKGSSTAKAKTTQVVNRTVKETQPNCAEARVLIKEKAHRARVASVLAVTAVVLLLSFVLYGQ